MFDICRATWFSRATDDGLVYPQLFDPIRPETIVLIYTAVRICLLLSICLS